MYVFARSLDSTTLGVKKTCVCLSVCPCVRVSVCMCVSVYASAHVLP